MNKKNKKIFTIILLLLVCSLITAFIVKPSKEETYAKEFLKKFYTISDYEQFTYLIKSSSASVNIDKQDAVKYRSYFTDNGYEEFVAQKISAFYEELAYENKCTLSVKSVDFNQVRYENFDELREFTFKAVIEVRYTDTKTIHTITQEGSINVITKNGENKIDSIQFTGQEEIEKEIENK